jgi:hypothetical protein
MVLVDGERKGEKEEEEEEESGKGKSSISEEGRTTLRRCGSGEGTFIWEEERRRE